MIISNNKIIEYKSKRGGRIIVVKDFIYNFETKIKENLGLRFQNRKYRGKIVTDTLLILISETNHNHKPDKSKITQIMAHSKLLDKSLNTRETANEIVSNIKAIIPIEHIEFMNKPR
ncbi:hypothetical protein DMUE_2359 [Dictyocoela muelleri]|nr:hypothetical protein DMUE_2359 [Dictyocoela muelleri]